MYQSEDAVEELFDGAAAVDLTDGTLKVQASMNIADGIEAYKNLIPESSYTQNTVPALSVPVTLQIIQNGKTVYESSDKEFTVDGAGAYEFAFDITGAVDTGQTYEVIWKAACFDRVIILAQNEVAAETEEPGTEEPGTEEPGTEEPGTEEPGTEEPGTEEPGTEEPGTEEPGTEEPGTDKPSGDKTSGTQDVSQAGEKGQSKAVKTGDSGRMAEVTVMLELSVAVIAAAVVLRRLRRR